MLLRKQLALLLAIASVYAQAKPSKDEIFVRDIFHCLRTDTCYSPIHGWVLKYGGPGYDWAGSVDISEFVFTASKGTDKRYFWVHIETGVEEKTGQSVDMIRVRQLESPDQSPYNSDLQRHALWSDDHSLAWLDGKYGGTCIEHPLSNLPESSWPVTQDGCLAEHNAIRESDDGETWHNIAPILELKQWKDTPQEKQCY